MGSIECGYLRVEKSSGQLHASLEFRAEFWAGESISLEVGDL